MTLKKKLFINFTVLFLLLLNLFGVLLIKIIFYTSLNNKIDSGFNEYSVIYYNLKSGENMYKLLFNNNDKDIITLKNSTYLKNSNNPSLNLIVEDMNKNIVYSSTTEPFHLDEKLYNFTTYNSSNYMIKPMEDGHKLIINNIIYFGDNKYYFTYINNIEDVYTENRNYFIILIIFNILSGIISSFVIYYFSKAITKPLEQLTYNINEIILRNYDLNLEPSTEIKELNMLADSFNTMSNEISHQFWLLEKSNEEKQRFIDSLTHEIRTPLTSIIGYSSLFLHKKQFSEDAILKSFENIYTNGKRLESLSENLIKLITINKAPLDIKKINIISIINEVKNTYANSLEKNNIKFSISGNDFNIYTDEALTRILLSNFIDNSIKATVDSENKNISIILNDNSIIISDTGKGMSKEDLEKIFEPFFMADKSRKYTSSGFGLGLSICHSIMNILNINYDIKSELNKGTTITLVFDRCIYEKI